MGSMIFHIYPASGKMISRDDLARQERWVPEEWNGYQRSDPDLGRLATERPEQCPGLEFVVIQEIQIVVEPGGIEAEGFNPLPSAEQFIIRSTRDVQDPRFERCHERSPFRPDGVSAGLVGNYYLDGLCSIQTDYLMNALKHQRLATADFTRIENPSPPPLRGRTWQPWRAEAGWFAAVEPDLTGKSIPD
jgi:hypothetical protein